MSRAYHCKSYDSETNESVIIFAESRSEARYYATDELCTVFTDVRAVRAPWADNLPRQKRYYGGELGWQPCKEIDWDNPIVKEALRARGWWEYDYSTPTCDKCGHQVWESLPLSTLEDGVCGYCRRDSGPTSEQ